MYVPERTPDLVVINLAGNDDSMWYNNGGNTQGSFFNNETFDAKFANMINTVTGLYGKDIPILFAYGCMEVDTYTPLATVRSKYLIENVYTEDEGYNVRYVILPTNRDGYISHPTDEGAQLQAETMTNFIKENYSVFD